VTRHIAVLGSTGSIGTQALDVVARLGKDRARVVGLAAFRVSEALAAQSEAWPEAKIVAVERDGTGALVSLATLPDADTVVVAVAGAAGLEATLAACRAGKRVCIATKEVLVAAGDLVTRAAREGGAQLLPIDSEHSALFQCVQGYPQEQIERLWITASGGPFRTWPREKIQSATVEEALNHPTWKMGGKITIDSATLMNKGLEVIEACWLFGLPEDRVEVVVHPQSVVHSFAELRDGALLAQLGLPDMRLPIQIALLYPEKIDTNLPRIKPTELQNLTFETPDFDRFPSVPLAREAFRRGGTAPATLNAANEAAVGLFLSGTIPFGGIIERVEQVLREHTVRPAETLEAVLSADAAARGRVRELAC
jgi:1-deoxy-D-xylulose-5-phosphate reductoisomerase